ncbi:CUE domain-containing protein 1 [Schistocerca nitens]|uniref:CUE domain-containing protein 1 n=1 Tax=Schistocerca nitens TaxID=7011 RepID=UPI0021184676|nr:CUE domain-containing protein 1 [Schistocerca nitens]
MATVQQPTTQLEFHQAMADFRTMFPDMDDEVIEAVLRANQGAVDATIDQLLAMTTDNENEKLRNEIEQKETLETSKGLGTTAEVAIITSSSPAKSPQRPASGDEVPLTLSTTPPLHSLRGWVPPLVGPLPDDFLRITPATTWDSHHKKQAMMLNQQMLQKKFAENQKVRGVLCDGADPELDRYLEDERIALFLQNEEFMAELRWNKDFLSTLEKDQADESPPEETLAPYPLKPLSAAHDEDDIFRERLRNMGKMSRKKFAQLARVFTRRKKRSSAKAILSQGPAPSRDNLLLNAEPLLDDDDDDDMDEHVDKEAQSGHVSPQVRIEHRE